MKPIEIVTKTRTKMTSKEICNLILDVDLWSSFKGYLFLPGIKSASFELKTENIVGSKIRVISSDNSSYIEEIIEWDIKNKVSLKFIEFSPPLDNYATHFIETIEFKILSDETEVIRKMTMYPKSMIGKFILIPISRLMKKALINHMSNLYK